MPKDFEGVGGGLKRMFKKFWDMGRILPYTRFILFFKSVLNLKINIVYYLVFCAKKSNFFDSGLNWFWDR